MILERLEFYIFKRLKRDPEEKILWWEGEWWTSRRLLELSRAWSEKLVSSGFGPGDRLAIIMPNCPVFLALCIAVWENRGTVVTLNGAGGSRAVSQTLELADPYGIVISEIFPELAEDLEGKGFAVNFSPKDTLSEKFIGEKSSYRDDPSVAVIFATSGTTGAPKAVPLYHRNIADNSFTVFECLEDMNEEDIFLNVLPNFHSLGFTVAGIMPLLCGMKQVILSSFMPPSKVLEAMREGEVTVLAAVPAMLSFLVSTTVNTGVTVPDKLRMIIVGGDRLNVQLDERVRKIMGVGVLEGYGLTECSPVVCVNRSYGKKRAGTVGPLIPGYLKQIRDLDGNVLSGGKEGILWVKGPSVTDGYYRSSDLTEERFQDGWFNTGDFVTMDPEGYVRILDRATDIIIVGGFNVYPQEVESVVNSISGVSESVAVGMSHPVNGEVVKVFVMRADSTSVTEREIIQQCKKELAHFKVPRRVEFLDSFPLSATGKVLRRKLRERARN